MMNFHIGHLTLYAPFEDEKVTLHSSVYWRDRLDVALMHMPATAPPWLDERPSPPAFFVRLHGVFGPYPAHALRYGHEPEDLRKAEAHPNEWVVWVGRRPWWKLMDDRPRLLKLVEEAIVKKGRMSLADLRFLRDLLKEVGHEG